MNISGADGILWAAGFAGHLLLLVILFFSRRAATYPIFSGFIAFSTIRTVLLFFLWRLASPASYVDAYWALVGLDTLLQFGLIWEIARAVFKRRNIWADDVRRQLITLCLVSIIGALWFAHLQQTRGFGVFQTTVLKANYCAAVFISALFAGMIVMSSRACVNWKSHVASIAAGMAVYSFLAILIEAVDNLSGFGGRGTLFAALQMTRKFLYLACVIYWSYSLSRTEPPQRTMSARMAGQLSALRDAVIGRNSFWDE